MKWERQLGLGLATGVLCLAGLLHWIALHPERVGANSKFNYSAAFRGSLAVDCTYSHNWPKLDMEGALDQSRLLGLALGLATSSSAPSLAGR